MVKTEGCYKSTGLSPQMDVRQDCLLDNFFFRNGHAGGGVGLADGGDTTLTLKRKNGSFDLETYL